MYSRSTRLAGLLITLMAACAPVDDAVDDSLDGVDEVASNPQNLAFVTLRPDTRRCISPLCGGYWVRRLNRSTMRCVDGRYAGECYVGSVDWSALALTPERLADLQTLAAQGRALLRGRIDPMRDARWSETGELVVSGGWEPLGSALGAGAVWTASDNGVRCVTAPCAHLDAARVNVASSRTTLTEVLLSDVAGASRAELRRVSAALQNPAETVLLSGSVTVAGRARTLRATQAWLQVSQPVHESAFCTDGAQCAATVFHSDVSAEADCYCPFCPSTATTTETAESRARSHRRFCTRFRESCPVPRCIAPRPVACVNHACAFE